MTIRGFEDHLQTSTLSTELVQSIDQIIDAAEASILSEQQLRMLADSLVGHYPQFFSVGSGNGEEGQHRGSADDPGYGADFDLADEVNEQIKAVRALRQTIMDDSGTIREGVQARDVKEMVSSSNTLLGSLMRFHDKIINQDRMRLVEKATIEAVKTLPEEQQEIFFDTLQKGLDAIS